MVIRSSVDNVLIATNGTNGQPGAAGTSSYIHVKYSDDGGQTFTANSGETIGSYIGIYRDYTEADSSNVTDYQWKKIEGEDGAPAYTIILSNENFSISTDTSYIPIHTQNFTCNVTMLKGSSPADFSITASTDTENDIVTTVNGHTVTIAVASAEALSAPQGVITLTITTIEGQNTHTFTKDITWSVAVQGQDGQSGAAGVSITDVTNYYLATLADSGVTKQTTGWTTTIQNMTENDPYLWNYEVITGSNGQTISSTEPVIIGRYGRDGEAASEGRGIYSITEHYQTSSSNTTPPSTWSDIPIATDNTNKYLWNYETITYTDNTSEDTQKRVIGTHGTPGGKGDTGRGIASITEYFLLSDTDDASKITFPEVSDKHGWTTVGEALIWSKNKPYLWHCTEVVYENPNSTVYIDKYCDTSWKAADLVQSNLTDFQQGVDQIVDRDNQSIRSAVWENTYTYKPKKDAQGNYIYDEHGKIVPDTDNSTSMAQYMAETIYDMDGITSRVSSSESSIDSLGSRVSTAESTITQHATDIEAKVSKDGVIAAINLSTETEGGSTAKISADKVEINGTAIFNSISSDVNNAIESKGYATTTQAQGYANTAQQNAIDQIPTDISELNNDAGYQTANDVDGAINTATNGLLSNVTTKTQYYLSTSSSSATGGSWQDIVPAWSSNKYIWTRVATTKTPVGGTATTTYSDGVYDSALTTALSDLQNKADSSDAVKSVVTTQEYYLSSSASSVTGGSWSSNFPTWSSGKYIWTRFKIVKTPVSGTATTSYSPSEAGVYNSTLTTALSTANSAQATANAAAPKTDAVSRTQRIYYRKTTSGAPAKNTTWLASSGTGYGNWSLSIPQLTDSNGTKYLYLYTAVQTQTVAQQAAGTACTCSDVLIDDTATIIDGGTIITGTVTAREITTDNLQGDHGWINLKDGKFYYGDESTFAASDNAISWNGSKLQIKADEFLLASGKSIFDEIEAIETWFYATAPTTSNEPASNWTTDNLKEMHLRDIYFDTNSGKSYRWAKDGTTYKWVEIEDKELSALAGRVATAETNISSNTEQIALRATKTEVANTYATKESVPTSVTDLSDADNYATKDYADGAADTAEANAKADTATKLQSYYTKTETDSAISQTAEGITTRVTKLETRSVGNYATSSTGAGTTAKVATIVPAVTGWELYKGAVMTVKFTAANTTSAPTLNVNSTGAKPIKTYSGGNLSEAEYKWVAGTTMSFVYDGTNWRIQDSSELTRLKSAETSISQNAEAITLRATKTEAQGYATTAENNAKADTTEKLKSYSTTTEMNSAIEQKANEITSSVSTTYATKTSVPTKTSDLTNDSNFATESYADGKASSAESAAKTYADGKASDAETAAKGYADTQIGTAKTEIKQTTDAITQRIDKTEIKIAGNYATSSTAASTKEKVATIIPETDDWELYNGAVITVKFTNANTNSAPTLNINSTGNKNIKTYSGGNLSESEYKWDAGSTMSFVYDGTNWRIQDSTELVRIKNAESSITQTATSIESIVSANDTYTKPDGTTATNTLKSLISQNTTAIEAKVDNNGVIAAINLSTETDGGSTAKIHADKVNIEGAAIFTSGRLSSDSLNDTIDGRIPDIPDDISDLTDSTGVIPTNTSDLNNDSGFQTENDVSSAISTATSDMATNTSIANTYALKTSAVAKTQRIYYRSSSSTKPTAYPTAWVTEEGDKWNSNATTAKGWSRKVTPISDGTGANVTKYLYLWTATQKQMVNGTVATLTADDIALDDSTTVIDGGKIITGTVDTNQLNANAVTAEKIAVNAVTAEKIESHSISTNHLNIGDNTNLSQANENIPNSLPGRIWNGTSYEEDGTSYSNGYKLNIQDGYLVKKTATQTYMMFTDFIPSSFQTGDELYYEFYAKADSATTISVNCWGYSTKYTSLVCTDYITGINLTTDEQKISGTIQLAKEQWNTTAKYYLLGFNNNASTKVQISVRKVIFRKKNGGELIVDGTLRVENFNSETQEKVLNSEIQVGGRNILYDTNAPSLVPTGIGGGIRYISNASTIIDNGVGTEWTLLPDSPISEVKYGMKHVCTQTGGQNHCISFYQAADRVDFLPGCQYTVSYWVKSDVAGAIVTITLSSNDEWDRTEAYTYTIQDIDVWERISVTFTYLGTDTLTAYNQQNTILYLGFQYNVVGTVWCCGYQVEVGNMATNWSEYSFTQKNYGGRNLIRNTNNIDLSRNETKPNINGYYDDENHYGNVEVYGKGIVGPVEHGIKMIANAGNSFGIRFGTSTENADNIQKTLGLYGLIAGETYTLSFDTTCKISSAYTGTELQYLGVYLYGDIKGDGTLGDENKWHAEWFSYPIQFYPGEIGTEKEGHVIFTFTIPSNATRIYLSVRPANNDKTLVGEGDFIEMRNIKLERGNHATDWSPAPEDIGLQFNDVNNRVETLNEFQSGARGWMEFKDAELTIGKKVADSNDIFTTVIDGTKMAFKQNDEIVAYISNKELSITDAKIQNNLTIGRFLFRPHESGDGGMSLIWS